jgi:hypothetical protein
MRMFMLRLAIAIGFAAIPAAALADAQAGPVPCRVAYVIPYTEQCTFAYQALSKERSPASLQAAFTTCDRAQNVTVPCVKSPTKQVHVVALSALYTDVSAQAEIAMFAGQYSIAETLLREKLTVIDAVSREAKPGDTTLQPARESTEQDIADALAGQCTWKALSTAGKQQELIRSHGYGELASLLQKKANDYAICARLAATPQHRAYVEYMEYVALEEGGRAAQAAGQGDNANHLYRACISGTARSSGYATTTVKTYLGTVKALCRGRLDGRYRVDQPVPMDADDGRQFRPLSLPKG